jgi:hypothetical protein
VWRLEKCLNTFRLKTVLYFVKQSASSQSRTRVAIESDNCLVSVGWLHKIHFTYAGAIKVVSNCKVRFSYPTFNERNGNMSVTSRGEYYQIWKFYSKSNVMLVITLTSQRLPFLSSMPIPSSSWLTVRYNTSFRSSYTNKEQSLEGCFRRYYKHGPDESKTAYR